MAPGGTTSTDNASVTETVETITPSSVAATVGRVAKKTEAAEGPLNKAVCDALNRITAIEQYLGDRNNKPPSDAPPMEIINFLTNRLDQLQEQVDACLTAINYLRRMPATPPEVRDACEHLLFKACPTAAPVLRDELLNDGLERTTFVPGDVAPSVNEAEVGPDSAHEG